jgi:hypothetical protein
VALADLGVADRLEDGRPASRDAGTDHDGAGGADVSLACEAPGESGRPISQWSAAELAEEVKQRGIVERISPRHAAPLLKRGVSGRTGSAIG